MNKSISKITKRTNVTILDCTLRDGGYYNNWDFDSKLVHQYINAMSLSGVDIVEIGFRSRSSNVFLGAFSYSTDDYLTYLNIPENLTIAVMVNASELLSQPDGGLDIVGESFSDAASSPVSMVRIAIHSREIEKIRPVIIRLSDLGYKLAINLMQVDLLTDEELAQAAREVETWGKIDVLYFADSLGNLAPASIDKILHILKSTWHGEIGFHAHDNKGQALINCMTAIDAGVTWVDATIRGMGRGAGNVRIENLILELEHRESGAYNMHALYPLVVDDFAVLQRQYGWGPSFFYHLAAIEGIHPTYVQELLASSRYSSDEILLALKYLSGVEAHSYSSNALSIALQGSEMNGKGSWCPKGWAKDNDVLIIGSGPSTERHMEAITHYVSNHPNLKVLCLNINRAVPEELVSAYVACNQSRILIESYSYSKLNCPIILPLAEVPKGILHLLDNINVLDYGLNISAEQLEIYEAYCILPSALAVGYAISVAIEAGGRRVLMAGFDGYTAGDSLQEEMIEVLEQFKEKYKSVPLIAVTPTTYPISQRSIYEPDL